MVSTIVSRVESSQPSVLLKWGKMGTKIGSGARSSQVESWTDQLELLMTEAGLSPEQLSTRAGLGKNTVRRWIGGKSCTPRRSSVKKVEQALTCELSHPVRLSPSR